MAHYGGYGAEDYDEENQEEDDTDYQALQSVEDNVMVLIDARPSMFVKTENHEMPLVTALRVTRHLLRQKVMLSQKDYVGIVAFGVDKVEEVGEGNGDAGGYTLTASSQVFGHQVAELQPLEEPTAKRIKDVERLCRSQDAENLMKEMGVKKPDEEEEGGSSSGLRDGIRACLRALEQARKKKERDSRRIWLFTDEDDPTKSSDDPSQVIRDAQDGGVEVRLWYFPNAKTGQFDESKFYQPLLEAAGDPNKEKEAQEYEDEEEAISDRLLLNAGGDLEKLLVETRNKVFKKRRYSRKNLILAPAGDSQSPAIALSVALYKTIQPSKKPTPIQLAAASNKRLATKTKWMCETLAKYVDLEMDTKYGIDFADQMVTFDKKQYEELKRAGKGEQGIHLLGFVPSSDLAWELNVTGGGTMIYPEEATLKGCTKAFIALREAMIQRDVMALVRYQAGSRTEPRMAVLTTSNGGSMGLELIILPYLDDIRDVVVDLSAFAPTVMDDEDEEKAEGGGGGGIRASQSKVELACAVLSRLEVADEIFMTTAMPSPALQKFYSVLQALALEESEGDWDETKDDLTLLPDEAILGAAEKELKRLWSACPERDKVKGGGGGPTKRKAEGGGGGGTAKKKKKADDDDDDDDDGEEEKLESVDDLISSGRINTLTNDKLKQYCRFLKVPVSGKKADLIDRIKSNHAGGD